MEVFRIWLSRSSKSSKGLKNLSQRDGTSTVENQKDKMGILILSRTDNKRIDSRKFLMWH